jgi:hypothetical protein
MLAETLFSGIRVSGFREIEFELTPHGAALGLAEALPAGGLELRVSGYGRGERSQTSTIPICGWVTLPPGLGFAREDSA